MPDKEPGAVQCWLLPVGVHVCLLVATTSLPNLLTDNVGLSGQLKIAMRNYVINYRANKGTLTYIVQQSAEQEAAGAVAVGLQMETCDFFIEWVAYYCICCDSHGS